MTKDLYNTKEVSEVRALLLHEQDNLDAATNFLLNPKDACLDHMHDDEQLVRAVLHRQVNAYVGKLENNYTRMISWWYPEDLPTFLEQCAEYLRAFPGDTRYRHPGWQKKIKTRFNKLSTGQMKQVLKAFDQDVGKNLTERKKIFGKLVMDRSIGYNRLREVINKVEQSIGDL